MTKNTKNQNKNKILTIIITIITILFTTLSIFALTNYFSKERKERIQLMNSIPIFDVERTGGNNEDKILLPIPVPNLNPAKYNHLITIEHKVTLNHNGMDIQTPLYLKVSTKYDTQQTLANPEKYFNVGLKTDNNDYDDIKRPQIKLNDRGIGLINIQISIEQKEIINTPNPKLNFICNYELVDYQGKVLDRGSQTIQNKISNIITI
ncbi:putative effector, AYWB SAP09-like protein [Maize bushy stunt phytoplasma]|uniref:Effector, AYWB SAP09-like protein n=1 Tax=Maize bushy stunt phytoplasma TaxID=202462 RepID=A0ABM6DLK1_9MOLU|nr:hypothetical protein [Maize bushy stunt phytoplasma]AOF54638.1 putative effector, AYWB SAP09-like protein [Maize bushy stunt phytoplasma]